MSNKLLVPSQQSVGWDVVRVSGEEEYSFYSSSGSNYSSSTSPCQVSSSSALQRSPSRKKPKEDTREVAGVPSNNDFVSEDCKSSQEEQVDPAGATMGYDATGSYRSRNTHRRVSSPHPDGNVRKSNKPQMERRRRQRINESVNELRKCISEVFKVDPSRHDKLEKADILELTVKYFHFIRSKCNTGDGNIENRPIRFENKKITDDFSSTDRFDNGMNDLRYNNINEQPVTLIIQTLPQNYQNQFGMRDQCLVGFNGNSVGAQPSSLLPNNSPPVIQLNITNNITNPGLDSVQCLIPSQIACQPENQFVGPIYPDTTTKEVQQEISQNYCIYKEEMSQVEGCISEPSYVSIDNSSLHHNKKIMSLNRETLQAKRISMGRPIAPKPPLKADNIVQLHAMPQINQDDQNEQVWRPWDANRKLLKPHIVR